MKTIEDGVAHLHSLGLAHNDLKPSNVMVDRHGKAVLIYFGGSAEFGKARQCTAMVSQVGRPSMGASHPKSMTAMP